VDKGMEYYEAKYRRQPQWVAKQARYT